MCAQPGHIAWLVGVARARSRRGRRLIPREPGLRRLRRERQRAGKHAHLAGPPGKRKVAILMGPKRPQASARGGQSHARAVTPPTLRQQYRLRPSLPFQARQESLPIDAAVEDAETVAAPERHPQIALPVDKQQWITLPGASQDKRVGGRERGWRSPFTLLQADDFNPPAIAQWATLRLRAERHSEILAP